MTQVRQIEGFEFSNLHIFMQGGLCKNMADMLKEKLGIDASVNLAARLVKWWKETREGTVE